MADALLPLLLDSLQPIRATEGTLELGLELLPRLASPQSRGASPSPSHPPADAERRLASALVVMCWGEAALQHCQKLMPTHEHTCVLVSARAVHA